MLLAARHCKGVPQMRENGSPLRQGNAGNAYTGPVAMVGAARRRKGVPQMRENGSSLRNAGNAYTGPVAMVGAARRRKGVPKRRKNGSPLRQGRTGTAATRAVAMLLAARHCKGVAMQAEQSGLDTNISIGQCFQGPGYRNRNRNPGMRCFRQRCLLKFSRSRY